MDKFGCQECVSPCEELTTVDVDANNWDSGYVSPDTCTSGGDVDNSCKCDCLSIECFPTPGVSGNPGCTEFPIGGNGQVNGGFIMVTLEDGTQIGIRAVNRFQPIVITPTDNEYEVEAGNNEDAVPKALWNIDWHVDLRPGNKDISDYNGGLRMTAQCLSATGCDNFGPYDFDIALSTITVPSVGELDFYGTEWTFNQQSENPGFTFWPWFGNFNPDAEATYEFCIILGEECPVCMQVVATEPEDEAPKRDL